MHLLWRFFLNQTTLTPTPTPTGAFYLSKHSRPEPSSQDEAAPGTPGWGWGASVGSRQLSIKPASLPRSHSLMQPPGSSLSPHQLCPALWTLVLAVDLCLAGKTLPPVLTLILEKHPHRHPISLSSMGHAYCTSACFLSPWGGCERHAGEGFALLAPVLSQHLGQCLTHSRCSEKSDE